MGRYADAMKKSADNQERKQIERLATIAAPAQAAMKAGRRSYTVITTPAGLGDVIEQTLRQGWTLHSVALSAHTTGTTATGPTGMMLGMGTDQKGNERAVAVFLSPVGAPPAAAG